MNTSFKMLTAQQCCLYIIDPQERLMRHINQAEQVSKNIALLIHLAKTLDIPILANTQYKQGIGPIIPELQDLLADTPCPDKLTFNALADAPSKDMLNKLPSSINTVILCGIETHICVYQTCKGAMQAGFHLWIAADAVSSRTAENNHYGQERMRELGAIIAPTEMIIYELLQQAGTPAFKTMLPYLK
jgi:nicotinamidase-related amidase